jgi:hypothetical protein
MWPFETMTEQEVFDKVAEHLLTQNAQSLGPSSTKPNGMCAYRGNNGLMCAAGCLIPDDKYKTKMEEFGWDVLVKSGRVPSSNFEMLIVRLQNLHDNFPVVEWKKKLKAIAEQHNLEFKFDNFTVPAKSNATAQDNNGAI